MSSALAVAAPKPASSAAALQRIPACENCAESETQMQRSGGGDVGSMITPIRRGSIVLRWRNTRARDVAARIAAEYRKLGKPLPAALMGGSAS